MKIKNILLILVIAVSGTACSDWFDVSPRTNVKTEDLFQDEVGFQSALTGIYGRMTNDATYGKNLSWFFLEKLVQRYDDQAENIGGQNTNIYDYTDIKYSKNILSEIYQEMYKTIANINNLLTYLDKQGQDILITPGLYETMKGEALGLRAYHHFDLLRMFGPIYKENPNMYCLPYRKEFKPEKSPFLTATEILNLVIDDLQEADKYLAQDSVIWEANTYRGFRMNKYAVKALMARVYLYRGTAEDLQEAARLAKEVIDHSHRTLVRDNKEDISMFNETLFALHMNDMEERLKNFYSTGGGAEVLWLNRDNAMALAQSNTSVGANDIRFKSGYGFYYKGDEKQYMICRKFLPAEKVNQYGERIPLIRLSEMYLILAEATKDVTYLNELRNARGISSVNDVSEVTTEALNVEYCKEFFAEGQYFYFIKRHGMKNFYRCPTTLAGQMSSTQYVFPLPDDEQTYN